MGFRDGCLGHSQDWMETTNTDTYNRINSSLRMSMDVEDLESTELVKCVCVSKLHTVHVCVPRLLPVYEY